MKILGFRVVRSAAVAAGLVLAFGSARAEVTISVDGGNGLVSIDGATPARQASKSVEPGTKVTLSYQASEEPSVGFYQWEGMRRRRCATCAGRRTAAQ